MGQVNPWVRWVLAVAACLPMGLGAAPADGSTAMTPEQVSEDFELAVKVVEAGLPDLAWFQSERAWRLAKRDAHQALSGARDAEGLFRLLRPLLSRIGEGHLSLQRSPAMKLMDGQAHGS